MASVRSSQWSIDRLAVQLDVAADPIEVGLAEAAFDDLGQVALKADHGDVSNVELVAVILLHADARYLVSRVTARADPDVITQARRKPSQTDQLEKGRRR
jgi:hypothetical protein